jgi:hypothetical protein
MMRLWVARVSRMSRNDYAIACEVLALAAYLELALRVVPVSRLLERLGRPSATRRRFVSAQRLERFVTVAYDVLPFPPTCLRRSLVMYRLLWRRGVRCRIRFGVAKNGSALDAHAWLVTDTDPQQNGSPRFVALTSPAEKLPDVLDEQLRFLERREVSTAGHIG